MRPPRTVSRTPVPMIADGPAASRSRSRTMRSASMPGAIRPRRCVRERGERGARRVRLQRVGERQPLRRQPAAGGLAVHGLAVDGVVERDERVVRDHRPVGAEREPPPAPRDRRPRPGPARPLRPDVPGPHDDLVGRRVAVVRLHRRDDAQRPRTGGCRRGRWSRCARRGGAARGSRAPPRARADRPPTARSPRAACSNASRAMRTPRSPMACSSTCQPRRSASATKASSSSGSQAGRPRLVSSS